MNGITVINRPVDTVVAYVIDLSNDKNWRTGVDETRWADGETMAIGAVGIIRAGNATAEFKIIAYTPDESVDWEFLSGPIKGRGGYRFVPVDSGTQFTLVADVEPTGLMKLLGPLFARMGRRQNQADVEKLRDILESAPA
ncbi:MAG: SRPBCC family protein [Anaerolineales bacterium]|nr:SRPBCC family protein [Anaerolineales bacterium]